MGGLMGRVADAAGIQFRLLNRRRGQPSRVPVPRSDALSMAEKWKSAIKGEDGIRVVEDEVFDLLIKRGTVSGVELREGGSLRASTVVVTTGTFLGGTILKGDERYSAGRMARRRHERLPAAQVDWPGHRASEDGNSSEA